MNVIEILLCSPLCWKRGTDPGAIVGGETKGQKEPQRWLSGNAVITAPDSSWVS